MKRILWIVAVILVASSCSTSKFSATGDKEKKFISEFLGYMNKDNSPQYEQMMDCISPKYIKSRGIDKAKYKVDNYALAGFSIGKYSNKGMVEARIWGQDRQWTHVLIFKLCRESGKLYLVPSSSSDSYISPWWERKTYVK